MWRWLLKIGINSKLFCCSWCWCWYLKWPPPPGMKFVKSFTPVRFQKKFNFTREKRVNRNIFGQKLRICFTRLFWTNCQFLCNYPLKLKLTQVVLWKLKPEYGKFHRWCNFFELHKCHMWQISCLIQWILSTPSICHPSNILFRSPSAHSNIAF